MRCEEARPLISAGLDGELLGPRAAGLRDHLAGCESCCQERAALAGTVRLLRAIPEVEPPLDLRRRIGTALLEEERRAQRRRLSWSWLALPRTAGWTWGAAAGAMLAAVILVTTHGGGRSSRVAIAPPRVSPPAAAVAVLPPGRSANRPAAAHKSAGEAVTSPAHPAARPNEPSLTASLPPVRTPPAALPSNEPVERSQPSHQPLVSLARANLHPHHAIRTIAPPPVPPQPARAGSVKEVKAAAGSASTDRDASHVSGTNPPEPDLPPSSDSLDSEDSSDTSGMTQMASTPAAAPPAEVTDDLVELRRRLKDRPLQAPELGQLKPASLGKAGRDGWIRF